MSKDLTLTPINLVRKYHCLWDKDSKLFEKKSEKAKRKPSYLKACLPSATLMKALSSRGPADRVSIFRSAKNPEIRISFQLHSTMVEGLRTLTSVQPVSAYSKAP